MYLFPPVPLTVEASIKPCKDVRVSMNNIFTRFDGCIYLWYNLGWKVPHRDLRAGHVDGRCGVHFLRNYLRLALVSDLMSLISLIMSMYSLHICLNKSARTWTVGCLGIRSFNFLLNLSSGLLVQLTSTLWPFSLNSFNRPCSLIGWERFHDVNR